MNYRIACYTLFDITKTGVLNRNRPSDDVKDVKSWIYQRNTQCNFDTILQAISLRSQPDVLTDPIKIKIKDNHQFGYLYKNLSECWTFDFIVQHPSVFEDGITELGALYKDCDQIPMIKCGTEYHKSTDFLNTSKELRNIYFVKYDSEH